ncbi:uncharacterized protein LOC101854856 [Aplysia californica]|uniref:Uncharacterized protein LOC101854856 n=1 Tax=Aplysia californica TaxID=6500 RepID=A0ABM1VQJ0_APLCA|nr:uncharacterized protein LOC101854856 [Aplysia californica]
MTSASLLATLFVAYVIWHGDVSVEAICDSLNLVPSGSVKSYGQEFRIPFPACRACSDSFQYLVIMTNPNPGNPKVTVNITINGISSTVDLSNETMEDAVTYNTYNSDDYMTVGTRITDKVALISSSDDIGLLVVTSNKMDGFTPLPVSSWGVFYVVVTHCVFRDEICQIVVVASKDADVTVDIPMEHQGTLTSQRSYKTQENLTNSLTAGQAWQIQRRVDLTGTTITSNVPVGVLAGAATAHVGNNETQGGFMEHLPPATQYGTEFIVFLTPNRVEDVMRIVALLHNTKVHITETERSRRFELKARQYISSTITGHVVHVESTRPIVVAKFSQSGKEHKYPTMTYISPTALHSKEPKIYVPGNPNLPSVSEVKIVVVTQKKYLSCLEGHVDHMLDQYELNVTDYIVAHYREPYLPSPLPMPVSCTDKHTLMTHAPFAVYLFIERDNGTTQVSVAPGSGVINPACEETVNESEGLFMNQDCFTLTKEDCSQSNSEAGDRDSYGLEFTFLIPEHYKLPEEVAASTIYLLVTKRSNETVNFTVSTPLGTKSMTYTMAPEKDTETVADFPRSTLALGSRITNRTVRVEATGEVSVVLLVVGEGQGTPSTLTARLLPDDVQGHEYYVVTLYQEEKDSQIQDAHNRWDRPIGPIGPIARLGRLKNKRFQFQATVSGDPPDPVVVGIPYKKRGSRDGVSNFRDHLLYVET